MDRYFCIVSLPGQPVADLCVLDARDDAAALRQAEAAAAGCPGWIRVEVFRGERRVGDLEPPASQRIAA